MANQQPPAAKPRSRTRLLVQTPVSLALVVAIFYHLLRGIDCGRRRDDDRLYHACCFLDSSRPSHLITANRAH